MSIRVASLLALGILLGCASQSSLMNVRDMSDERLVEYYHEIEADVEAITKELEEYSKSGRIVPSAVKQDQLNSLKKRRATVAVELRRRDIRIEQN